MFDSRSVWHAHELQFHRREWHCGAAGHKVYRSKAGFADHLQSDHGSEFSTMQLPTFIGSCERAINFESIQCPLCTEDQSVKGSGDHEPTIRRHPRMIPAKKYKNHVGHHLERLALFALSSVEEDHDDETSIGSDNLNSGPPADLSWVEDEDSSNSEDGPTEDRETYMLEELVHLKPKPSASSDSGNNSVKDELPAELTQTSEVGEREIHLPCRNVSIHNQNPYFLGRADTLAKLHDKLDPAVMSGSTKPRTFALCGPGGVGKTQTALSYVFEIFEEFEVVLWAHATSQVQLVHSFSNFAAELGVIRERKGKEEDPTIDASLLKEWFDNAGKSCEKYFSTDCVLMLTETPWLLIIDAADESTMVEEYLPVGPYGSILITSRDIALVSKYGGMVLGALDEENAVEMLLESIKRRGWTDNGDPHTRDIAARVVQRLGYVPLAINHAANYVASAGVGSLGDFITDYEQNELAYVSASVDQEVVQEENEIVNRDVLWNMGFSNMGEDEQRLLNTLSFFDPTGIPLDLLEMGSRGAKGHGSEFVKILQDDSRFQECVHALTESAVMIMSDDLRHLWMHQRNQELAQRHLDPAERQQSWNQAVALVDGAWPVAPRKKRRRADLWEVHTRYLPHVQSLVYWYNRYKDTADAIEIGPRFVNLLNQAAKLVFTPSTSANQMLT
jgi:hypothetical protein